MYPYEKHYWFKGIIIKDTFLSYWRWVEPTTDQEEELAVNSEKVGFIRKSFDFKVCLN